MSNRSFDRDVREKLSDLPHSGILRGINGEPLVQGFFQVFNGRVNLTFRDHVFLDFHEFLESPVKLLIVYWFSSLLFWFSC